MSKNTFNALPEKKGKLYFTDFCRALIRVNGYQLTIVVKETSPKTDIYAANLGIFTLDGRLILDLGRGTNAEDALEAYLRKRVEEEVN